MASIGLESAAIFNDPIEINNQARSFSKFSMELSKIEYDESELFDLLKSSKEFAECYEKFKVVELNIDQIGQGKGFLSQVFKLNVRFNNDQQFDFVLKIPKPYAFQEFIGNWKKDADNDHVPVDQCVINGHNSECDFYTKIHQIKGCPIPKVFKAEKYIDGSKPNKGLLLMEDLSIDSETLGFHGWANTDQSFAIVRYIAALQFGTDTTELKPWCKRQMTSYFEEFYTTHLFDSMPAIKELQGINELLPKLTPILSQKFGFYSLFEVAKEYGSESLCHGDLQPNNLFFKKLPDGQLSSQIKSIIDWQILFWGNSLFDLARFVVICLGRDNRQKLELPLYAAFYNELLRLYNEDGKTPNFTYEQGLHLYELAMCQQISFLVMFLGVYRLMNPNNTGPLGSIFDQLLDNAVYAAERAIEIFEKYGLEDKF